MRQRFAAHRYFPATLKMAHAVFLRLPEDRPPDA
jgi:hypothetical protein